MKLNSSQKQKIFFLVGAIWLLSIVLLGLSVLAWHFKVGGVLLLILLVADFLALSAAGTTLTVPFLIRLRKRRAKKEADKN
ncbi:hypothetical protein [Ligilactobacillus acidipiscis]|uniref:hypothetical protein n=1 Tax=Ligilactobacillus acidipiscis TaxID=89059 RepID=UPI0022DECD9D|nr:hypothetical protein [Ligilactobacillus acidipiscis]